MASQINAPHTNINSGAALAIYRLVKPDGNYAALDANRDWLGVTQEAVSASALPVTLRLPVAGTCKVVASEAIAVGDKLYKAANGTISKTATSSVQVGVAITAASGANSVFEAALSPA